ncbi:plasmid replication protein RepC [Polycladidibacter stylochi]|uniref:plasmid replication protein RepC n=1 Tax=Polycladidibacter stylochi TaxID=1807766 RepID=UPI00082A3A53|nr:plasmid replication protein RepC [Pseudovibrio stylochi]
MQTTGSVASFRKLTPAMVATQNLAMANDIVATTKSEVAMALKKAAPALGIDGTTYHVLDILIGLSGADDWQQDRRPIVAISNEKLAEYVCRSTRTVTRCLKRLVEAGVMAYKDSPTGRRYVHRGEYRNGKLGEIERGFGFDFSPARQRVHELKQIGEEFAARLKAEKDAKRNINRLLRALEDLRLLAENEKIDLTGILEEAAKLKEARLYVLEKAEVLQSLYEQAVQLIADTQEAQQEADKQSEASSFYQKMSGAGDITVSSYNNTNPNNLDLSNLKWRSSNEDLSNSADHEQVRDQNALEKDHFSKSRATPPPQRQADMLENVSIHLLASALTELQGTMGKTIASWADLQNMREEIALLMGLSVSAWHQAERRVGGYLAVAVLAVTAEKALRAPELISSPGGYFRACIDRATTGDLALHKSLYGLVSENQSTP